MGVYLSVLEGDVGTMWYTGIAVDMYNCTSTSDAAGSVFKPKSQTKIGKTEPTCLLKTKRFIF